MTRRTVNRQDTTEKFVAARNFLGRPTLMHKVFLQNPSMGICGVDMSAWSRMYFDQPVEILYCKKCKKLEDAGLVTTNSNKSNVIKFKKVAN